MSVSVFQGRRSTTDTFKFAKDISWQTPVFQGTWLQIHIHQSNVVGLFFPEAKGTLNCQFS